MIATLSFYRLLGVLLYLDCSGVHQTMVGMHLDRDTFTLVHGVRLNCARTIFSKTDSPPLLCSSLLLYDYALMPWVLGGSFTERVVMVVFINPFLSVFTGLNASFFPSTLSPLAGPSRLLCIGSIIRELCALPSQETRLPCLVYG